MLALTREAADLGFTAIGVTGGEPFLRSWMAETIAAIADLLPVVVLTNGSLLRANRERLAVLTGRDVQVQVSLDRPGAPANDRVRGIGNFEAALGGVRLARELGLSVRVASTVESLSEREQAAFSALLEELGVPAEDHVVRPVLKRGRAEASGKGVTRTRDDLAPELTITADGAFWGPFGPTVYRERLATDQLLVPGTPPLSEAAEAILDAIDARKAAPKGSDTRRGVR